ncbi:MAG: PmoA family protein [Planctomycetes bacterium]|nr:PmoA family protein [Planctomycetota bacterium]MCH9727875.1 PmoA family protein [Planctomycetota bacterium]MCH9775457.1 PmoA family protein [Planctomycetota bacterium]MCH9792155.1 PmoA family protein [Planctomycetota bacterium]
MSQLFPQCEIIPLPDFQFSFRVKGKERLRWHHDPQYSRPFFYPLTGPAGIPLTRIGHPGAPNHDHHRSVWFAHHKVLGINFWAENTGAKIIQKRWLSIDERDDEAILAVELEWFDGHDPTPLLRQESISAIRTNNSDELFLELQSTFYPTAESLEFQKTNFGFLAVRVAKSISSFFGGGTITNSRQQVDEKNIFGKPAEWMDYSGPVAPDVKEGITYYYHPSNSSSGAQDTVCWHVREDGWMGASPCMFGALETTRKAPLTFRFLLQAHAGELDHTRAQKIYQEFAGSLPYQIKKPDQRHTSATVIRVS